MTSISAFLVALALAAGGAPAAPAAADSQPPLLDLRALFAERAGVRVIAPEVEALHGHPVRVRGFMVPMEEPPEGVFYLASRPAECDESGGGTGDLPVESVLVRVPGVDGQAIPWRAAPVEILGTLEVGRKEEADGRVSFLRVLLQEPPAR
jgi:hypothetical protein